MVFWVELFAAKKDYSSIRSLFDNFMAERTGLDPLLWPAVPLMVTRNFGRAGLDYLS